LKVKTFKGFSCAQIYLENGLNKQKV